MLTHAPYPCYPLSFLVAHDAFIENFLSVTNRLLIGDVLMSPLYRILVSYAALPPQGVISSVDIRVQLSRTWQYLAGLKVDDQAYSLRLRSSSTLPQKPATSICFSLKQNVLLSPFSSDFRFWVPLYQRRWIWPLHLCYSLDLFSSEHECHKNRTFVLQPR